MNTPKDDSVYDLDTRYHYEDCQCDGCRDPLDYADQWCFECEHWKNECVCEELSDFHRERLSDSGSDVCGEELCVPASPFPAGPESTLNPDSWEFIAAQIEHGRSKDLEYWDKRREEERTRWLERNTK